MDDQNSSFNSPVQPQQPMQDSVVQPQQPFLGGASQPQPQQPAFNQVAQPQQPQPQAQPQQPFGATGGAQQPFGAAPNSAYQQPFGGQPAVPPSGYDPNFQPAYGAAGSYQPPASTGKATVALVLGIAAIVICFILPIVGSPVGIILGIVAIVMAGSFIKVNGPFGRAKAARICGIVGLVLSILSLLLGVAVAALFGWVGMSIYDDLAVTDVYEIIDDFDSDYSYDYDYTLPDYAQVPDGAPFDASALTSDEKLAVEVVSNEFDNLCAGEVGVLENIGAIADQGFYEATGLWFADCGIDPIEYASAITQGLTYEVDQVAIEGDSGYVGVYVTCKDIFSIYEDVYEGLAELVSAPGAEGMTDAEYNQHAGMILMSAVRDADIVANCNWAIIDVEYMNGEWRVFDETWDFEMDYMFSLV